MAPRPARIRSGPESVDEALAALDHYAASRLRINEWENER